jgi:hypothetical protein
LFPVLSDIPPFRRTLEQIGFGIAVDFAATPDPQAFLDGWTRFAAARPSEQTIAERLAPYSWAGVAQRIEVGAEAARGGVEAVEGSGGATAGGGAVEAGDRGAHTGGAVAHEGRGGERVGRAGVAAARKQGAGVAGQGE